MDDEQIEFRAIEKAIEATIEWGPAGTLLLGAHLFNNLRLT